MDNRNYCIITGIVVQKNRNANNRDMKRPIVDIEVVSNHNNGDLKFEKVPVLFSNGMLAKSVVGYCIGEIVTVEGCLREDNTNGTYVEAMSVTRMTPKTEKLKSLSVSRAELLQMPQHFNMVSIVGTVNENNTITVPRFNYSKGDLKKEDTIPFIWKNSNSSLIKKTVICSGFVGESPQNYGLCVNVHNIYIVDKKE